MRAVFGNPRATLREIGGQFDPGSDKIVTNQFGPVAKLLWPVKTAAHIAALGGVDERTAKRWLAGEFDAPIPVVIATIDAIFTRR